MSYYIVSKGKSEDAEHVCVASVAGYAYYVYLVCDNDAVVAKLSGKCVAYTEHTWWFNIKLECERAMIKHTRSTE